MITELGLRVMLADLSSTSVVGSQVNLKVLHTTEEYGGQQVELHHTAAKRALSLAAFLRPIEGLIQFVTYTCNPRNPETQIFCFA